MMYKLFKSILEQDTAPIVVCNIDSVVVYMNPAAIKRYHKDLTGTNVKECHPAYANGKIDRVLEWFTKSAEHNIVFTYYNEDENKDVYMVALRDDNKNLIGYYEKHAFRNRETAELYEMKVEQ